MKIMLACTECKEPVRFGQDGYFNTTSVGCNTPSCPGQIGVEDIPTELAKELYNADQAILNEHINPNGECGCCDGKGWFEDALDGETQSCMTCNGSGKG